jgi:hypothetical protein
MADYHTSETGAPHVYHNKKNCPDGKKIKKEHKKSGRGTGRHLCKECAKLTAK